MLIIYVRALLGLTELGDPVFNILTMIFDAIIGTSNFEKRRGCLVKNPCPCRGKECYPNLLLFNLFKKSQAIVVVLGQPYSKK
jgi:hypothetical protein